MSSSDGLKSYFLSNSGYWKWDDNEEVLVTVKERETIAFRTEIIAILRRLAPNGLPSFQLIVAMLTMFKSKDMFLGLASQEFDSRHLRPLQNSALSCVKGAPSALDRLQAIPRSTRSNLTFKVDLAESLFADCKPLLSPKDSITAITLLETGLGEDQADAVGLSIDDVKSGFAFYHAVEETDFAYIASRLKTGLSDLPKAAPTSLPDMATGADFLKAHRSHAKLRIVVGLAERLVAAVAIPRKQLHKTDAEMGGFSDISNRGPLDRLLISELANDDSTLAIRVAMNEAMYLRRELPAESKRHHRHILLHTGLPSWGVCRIYAAAVALAMNAANDSFLEFSCFRYDGWELQEFDLLSSDGLTEHLDTFSTRLHPGASLPEFFERISDRDDAAPPVLILSEQEFSNEEFQAQLAASGMTQCLVATLTESGNMHLFHWDKNGADTVRRADLDLADIVSSEDASSLQTECDAELPSIFSVPRFPLRLSHAIRKNQCCKTPHGLLAISNDQRLMLWEKPDEDSESNANIKRGGIQLLESIPAGKPSLLYDNISESALIVCQNQRSLSLVLLKDDFDSPTVTQVHDVSGAKNFLYYRGVLVVFSSTFFWTVDISTGQTSVPIRIAGSLCASRFIWDHKQNAWFAVSITADGAQRVPMNIRTSANTTGIITFVESPNRDGPIAVFRDGRVLDTGSGRTRQVSEDLQSAPLHLISADRERVLLTKDRCRVLVDARTGVGNAQTLSAHPPLDGIESVSDYFTHANIRKHLRGVQISASGKMVLVAKKGHLLSLQCVGRQLILSEIDSDHVDANAVRSAEFAPFKMVGGIQLQIAKFSIGANTGAFAEVFLDSRGLIHTRCAHSDIQEVSLVLKNGEVSGWCSTGMLFGNAFFHHPGSLVASPKDVFNDCITPIAELIRDQM